MDTHLIAAKAILVLVYLMYIYMALKGENYISRVALIYIYIFYLLLSQLNAPLKSM